MPSPVPVVSVLIPAYGVAPYIAETLSSVFAQNFSQPFEVIVVNDGSPDTAEFEKAIAPFRDRIVYIDQPNAGPSAARNAALRMSRAPLIALLDGDDVYLPEYLRVQTEMLAANPDAVLVYGDMEVFGGSYRDGRRLADLNKETEPPSLEALIRGTATVINTPMIRREAILAAGGWDETIRHSEDYDLWLRIAAGGGKLLRHSTLVARYRLRPDSLSSNVNRMFEGQIHAFEKLLRNAALSPALATLLERRIETARGDIAFYSGKHAFREGNAASAAAHFTEALKYRRSPKLWMVARLLTTCPWLLYAAFSLRARLSSRYRHSSRHAPGFSNPKTVTPGHGTRYE
jgi:glycosyltransferase involved in cell wall biosynthesis